MFSRRKDKALRQQEFTLALSERLGSPDAAVREKAFADAAQAPDLEWALRELAQALGHEPSLDVSVEAAGAFCDALCRDEALRERAVQIFARNLDAPEDLLREWTALVAELGGAPALQVIDADVRDDARLRLKMLREQGWTPEGLPGIQPGTFAFELKFGMAVAAVLGVVRRGTPLSAEDAHRTRQEARAAFKKALVHPRDSEERDRELQPLTELQDDESWSDRARTGLRIDEALALCESGEEDLVALGVEVISYLLTFHDGIRRDLVRDTLDGLVSQDPEPLTLSEILECYELLHDELPLTDPPTALFLDEVQHPTAEVRRSAALGLSHFAPGSPEETSAVDVLVRLLDEDVDDEVRQCAAAALQRSEYSQDDNVKAASTALARHADSADPVIRALSLADRVHHRAPDAPSRLLAELELPDPHWKFMPVVALAALQARTSGHRMPRRIRTGLVKRLVHLQKTHWADRDVDPIYPDAEDRAELLADALKELRA
ncbi:HEAT repeat domain-containing protein [Streptomyces flaveus]|uniref:HEAT repeat domain-containing protein n=1 Tax=Streptomyces flaveus TaxID=66370 RepID=A0A917QWZ7_9ACTN|nr:HEAT repeat domain-containing protein [Streptomyces flaveus]GGK74850.1 hypothetical protein GCM10010094_39830 [Streptomyces flaveus]